MRRTDKLPELLAPAGSFEHLKAAVKAGADAVYMGGRQFGARAYADNFSKEALAEALRYAHFYEKKLYLTVNTLIKEREIQEQLFDFLSPVYEEGLDGVIVQDIGAAAYIRQYFPAMEIHGSTQMTITDVYGARGAARLGMNRIVPARELSLPEIRKIKQETDLEIEVFVHGALCYCYSGQCLFSSMYGGRSGNRGRCAQPCRMPYRLVSPEGSVIKKQTGLKEEDGNYLLSPKDLCALPVLPSLIEAGVDSLKIEGRMKNVEYVAGVTAIYRKYLDRYIPWKNECKRTQESVFSSWKVQKEDYETLEELYSRSGFTAGYWRRRNGAEMISSSYSRNLGRRVGTVTAASRGQIAVKLQKGTSISPKDILVLPLKNQEEIVLTAPGEIKRQGETIFLNVPGTKKVQKGIPVYRRKNEKIAKWIEKDILQKEIKYPVTAEITIKIGEPLKLILRCRGKKLCLAGEKAEVSQNRPVTEDDIIRQMNKTGGVPFFLEHLNIDLDSGAFFPMSALKDLRQRGFKMLKDLLESKKNVLQSKEKSDTVISLNNSKKSWKPCKKVAVVYDETLWKICLSQDFFDGICFPLAFWEEKKLTAAAEESAAQGKKVFLSLPEILRSGYTKIKNICSQPLWSGIYGHTLGQIEFLSEWKERTAPVLASPSFYQWNNLSVKESLSLFDLSAVSLPVELSKKEAEETVRKCAGKVSFEWNVYGRIPIMRSAQCLKKTKGICGDQREILFLEDKKKRQFPVVSHCEFCYNSIWSSHRRNLIGEEMGELREAVQTFCFHFFLDEKKDVLTAIRDFINWEDSGFHFTKKRPDEYWKCGVE